MKLKHARNLFFIFMFFCLGVAPLFGRRSKLERVLAKLDSLNRILRTFRADIIQRKYIKLLEDFDEPEKGKLYFKKAKNGFLLKKEMKKPGHTILVINPREMIIFYPKKNQAVRRAINHPSRYQNIGIGTSEKELKKNFYIKFIKDEAIKNKIFHIIELIPRKQKIKNYFQKLRLWIDSQTGIPVRQQLYELNGDYTIIQFLNIRINKRIKNKVFELKLPKNVEFIS